MVYRRTLAKKIYKATRRYPGAKGALAKATKSITPAHTMAIARKAAATAIQAVFRSKRARKVKVPAARRRLSNRKTMYRKNKMRAMRYGRKPGQAYY